MADFIVYFSRAHQNYVNGVIRDLEVGNTEVVAKVLQKLTGADLFKIEPIIEYSEDYNKCIAQAQSDQRSNARPELKGYPKDLSDFKKIYVCYPNYWSTLPMPVFTFLEHFDFAGKTILPLCTHEGSGMGSSEKDIRRLCPGARVEKGLALRGGKIDQAESEIRAWLEQIGK
ncbi:flavodoxin [Solibaculum mannosilyticum]|uniref:Flavodoxin n=1 Tax=Solibaculum mannosilyticum TaxID=2780922 RepID=A0A7I8D4M6_9FIRM|nr:flavodoxin [Solibaculum mannosilyticum]BCI60732.1 flavodoxin [Solibaculum mannosilyticum]